MADTGVGLAETKYITFPEGILLDNGARLAPITVAYETYGELDEAGENALLVLHALTGDAHAAGLQQPDDRVPGWWDEMIGPGRTFDTDKYFVVCANVLGGCQGTTGPVSINPATGARFNMAFPVYTIRDMVRLQMELLRSLGVKKLLMAIGGSMGGMQALEWGVTYPDFMDSVVAIGCPGRLYPQAIAFNEVGRQGIMTDPKWKQGEYDPDDQPAAGLSLARMLGTITYKSDASMQQRFGRTFTGPPAEMFNLGSRFEVENYLHYQGMKLVRRFDANTYLYLTKAMDLHDVSRGYNSYEEALGRIKAKFLAVGIDSDILYPAWQQKELVDIICHQGGDSYYYELKSPHGHDAFLIEFDKMKKILGAFLDAVLISRK